MPLFYVEIDDSFDAALHYSLSAVGTWKKRSIHSRPPEVLSDSVVDGIAFRMNYIGMLGVLDI